MSSVLRLTQAQHERLRLHLLPGDGLEAAAIVLCGRGGDDANPLLVAHRVHLIAYDECTRKPDSVCWPLGKLSGLFDEAAAANLGVVKFHSHPGGYPQFSDMDNVSDAAALGAAAVWADDGKPHGSVIMLPEGNMIGRLLSADSRFIDIDRIAVVGDKLSLYGAQGVHGGQTFGSGTRARMGSMRIGVVGCSGTGSIVIEQLLRMGVGDLVAVDNDVIEHKNLDRILNSRLDDVRVKLPKVELVARTASDVGETQVRKFASRVEQRDALVALSQCDVLFGCVDSAAGRQTLNRLAAYYLMPYFDLGVRIEADGTGGVSAAFGAVHFIRPDGSTLLERGVVTQEALRAENLARTDPAQFADEARRGYIRGTREERPAVITLNMITASLAVEELLERLHGFRLDPASDFATVRFDLVGAAYTHEPEPAEFRGFGQDVGRGDCAPLLGMPALS